jgi:hypothetical protein
MSLIHLLIVLIIGIYAAVRKSTQKTANTRSAPSQPVRRNPGQVARPTQPVRAGGETDDERLRKFMEALGVPTAPEVPKRVVRPQLQPGVTPVLRPAQPAPPKIPLKKYIPPAPAPKPEPKVETFQVAPVQPQSQSTQRAAVSTPPAGAAVPGDLKTLLRNPASVRTAVLLREILGPPKGLQSSSGPGGSYL